MSNRLMRAGLSHRWIESDASFFARIDETGGWPVGYAFVGFEHTELRAAGFTNSPTNSGWWTVIATADDYYLWKLSPAALQRIADAVTEAIRYSIVAPRPERLFIKGSRGGKADISTTGKGK